jgi:tetratricopeptide (TPR) repeat protein
MLIWPLVGALIVGIIYLMNEGRLRKLGEWFRSFLVYLEEQRTTGSQPPARRFGQGYQGEADVPTPLVESDPRYAIVHYNRGNDYFRQGDTKEAISEYNKAIELNPTYANVYYNRGQVYKSLGKKEEALADLEQFIFFADDPALIEQAKKEMEELKK